MQEDILIGGATEETNRLSFYKGEVELIFDKENWQYHRVMPDGSLVPFYGVTSTCHIIDKSQVLMRWAVKMAMEKLRRILIERGFIGENSSILFAEILDEIIAEAKKADTEALNAAAEIGHTAHDWIERYIKALLTGNEERRLELLAHFPLDERAARACVAACLWMSDHDVRWIATERKCCSRKHRYAGTMDGLALVSACGNPACCPVAFKDRLTLVDWKTSNYLYIEYLLQTAAYQQAHQEETGEQIEDRWIIRLGKDDAEFDPWHAEGQALFETDLRGFLRALALVQSVEEIEARVAAIQAVKTELKHARAQAERDAKNLLACPASHEYKGVRKKKGCNGTNSLCQKCEEIWTNRNANGKT